MDDLRNHQSFFLALRAALTGSSSAGQTIDQFSRKFETALSQESGRQNSTPSPSTKQPAVTQDIEFVIPTPLPDELLQGWRGRVAALNCLSSIRDVERLLFVLGKQKAPSLVDDPDFVQCAAAVLDTTPQELIRRHTLTPFFDALDGLKQNKPGRPGRHLRAYKRRAPLRIDGKEALFCRQCVEEDLAFWKFSYWRRRHQLPGVHYCDIHETPLLSAGSHASFEHCPNHFLDAPVRECITSHSPAATPVLRRYAQIAAEILESAPAIDSSAVSSNFGERAKAAGLRISNSGARRTVTTYLMELLPAEWLQGTFPRVRWLPNKYISTIDGACTPRATRYTTATFCLLAAVFYDDADKAIVGLVKCAAPNREQQLGFDFWASRDVFDAYCANGGIVSRVAVMLGLPTSTVSLGLLNQGLPGLGKATAPLNALKAYAAGQSLQDACREANASGEAVDELLRAGCARLLAALAKMSEVVPADN